MNRNYYHPLWKAKRLLILERDSYKCINCSLSKELHVHHLCYQKKRLLWDYPDEELITVCESCHNDIHNKIDIKSFFQIGSVKTLVKEYEMSNLFWKYNRMLDMNKVKPRDILDMIIEKDTIKLENLKYLYWISGFSKRFIYNFVKSNGFVLTDKKMVR